MANQATDFGNRTRLETGAFASALGLELEFEIEAVRLIRSFLGRRSMLAECQIYPEDKFDDLLRKFETDFDLLEISFLLEESPKLSVNEVRLDSELKPWGKSVGQVCLDVISCLENDENLPSHP